MYPVIPFPKRAETNADDGKRAILNSIALMDEVLKRHNILPWILENPVLELDGDILELRFIDGQMLISSCGCWTERYSLAVDPLEFAKSFLWDIAFSGEYRGPGNLVISQLPRITDEDRPFGIFIENRKIGSVTAEKMFGFYYSTALSVSGAKSIAS